MSVTEKNVYSINWIIIRNREQDTYLQETEVYFKILNIE